METIDPARVERYRQVLTAEEFERVLGLLERPSSTAVRLNPLKLDPSEAIQTLMHHYGWEVDQIPFCPTGWALKNTDSPPGDTLEYRNGQYYIQDSSSMVPVEAFVFNKRQSDLILDMAAAPGGKTTHLAARNGDVGLIVANDSSSRRIRALASNLRTWGATSAVVTNLPGEKLGSHLPGVFDKVLLDAPCSGESLRASGGSQGRQVSEREREALQKQQIRLLLAGVEALRTGGELIYATCTAAPEENEAVIQTVLEQKAGQVELANIDLFERLDRQPGGLTHFAGRIFHPSMSSAVRLWPFHFDTGAFFVARVVKVGRGDETHPKPLGGTPPELIEKQACDGIHHQLMDFGFDLRAQCQRSGLVLIDRDRFVFAVSELWLERLPDLPVKEAGLPVGRWQGETFVPAHEWVTRYGTEFRDRLYTLDAEQTHRWLQGADLRNWTPPIERGAVLFQDEAGRFLGVGNVSAQRVRNMLPRSWVAG